jgi:hypothetical protein
MDFDFYGFYRFSGQSRRLEIRTTNFTGLVDIPFISINAHAVIIDIWSDLYNVMIRTETLNGRNRILRCCVKLINGPEGF